MDSEQTIEYLYRYFDKNHYNIEHGHGYYYIEHNNKHCITIKFIDNQKTIYIALLDKCSDKPDIGSGKELIKTVIRIAKDKEYAIELTDDSKIGNISLKWLFLLSRGETWYNSLGLKEDYYSENSDILREFIHLPIRALLQEELYDNLRPESLTYMAHLRTLLGQYKKLDTPIKTLFVELKEYNKRKELTVYEPYLMNLFLSRRILDNIKDKIKLSYFLEKYDIDISKYPENLQKILQDDVSLYDIIRQKTELVTLPFEKGSASHGGKSKKKYMKFKVKNIKRKKKTRKCA